MSLTVTSLICRTLTEIAQDNQKKLKTLVKMHRRVKKPDFLPFQTETEILNFNNCSDDEYENTVSIQFFMRKMKKILLIYMVEFI